MRTCPNCGEDNPMAARFCPHCGTALDAKQPSQERKLISVLFVDLVGFTSRSEHADPEDVRDLLEAYHSTARREIESFGGVVEKFIGDAVMAVFGAPISYGDDAQRAVLAGLAVLRAIEHLNASRPGLELKARAGISSGEAVVALGPAGSAKDALAMGDVVNTAARLQSAAPAQGVVAGEETYRLTRHAVTYDEIADIDAKGKSTPLRAWLAREAVQDESAHGRQTPFVGRRRELALLNSVWETATIDRRAQLVTVVGPPGIGKSRLQRELSARVEGSGGRAVRGRCLPYGERAAYGPFVDVIRSVAGIFENDHHEIARGKLQAALRDVLPAAEVDETTRFLSLLLGLPGEEPALQRDYLFYAAKRFLEGLAAQRPLLVVFEDLHWADPSFLELVEYLMAQMREAPVLILALARPEFLDRRPTWASGVLGHTSIGLEPLGEQDATALAEEMVSAAGRSAAGVSRLVAMAEGNPLFLEELAAAVAEANEDQQLPNSIRAAIAARLDALDPGLRDILLDASVVGRAFWKGSLAAVRERRDLDSALLQLESRGLIRRLPNSRVRGDVEYMIKHMLIRDIAYTTLPRAQRRERHSAAARYLEAAAGNVRDLAPLLAHHWREAGEPERAVDYLLDAAAQAERGWALDEVVSLYEAGIQLTIDDDRRRHIKLLCGLAQARLGAHDDAFEALKALLPDLQGEDRLQALLGWSWAAQWTERSGDTIAGAEEAMQLAAGLGNPELAAVATARLSQGLAMRGEPGDLDRAGKLGRHALEIWPADRQLWERANHEHLLAEQYSWTGALKDAAALTAASLGDRDPQSIEARLRSASLRAGVLCSLGDYAAGLRLFDETLELAQQLGRPVRIIQNYSTLPLRDLFDLKEARRRTDEAIAASSPDETFTMPRANAMADLVQTCILTGELGLAEQTWRAQWEDSTSRKAWTRWLVSGRLAAARADLALAMDDPETAVEWAQKAIDMAVPVHRLKYQALGRVTLGNALLRLDRRQEAVTQLRVAVADCDRLGSPSAGWRAKKALSAALAAVADDAEAEEVLGDAAAIVNGIAAGLPAERAELFLAAEPVREVLKAAGLTAPGNTAAG